MGEHYRCQEGCLLLRCRLQPRASKDEIVGLQGDRLKIRITSPPVDGKANIELVRFLADAFGCQRYAIALRQGEAGRDKLIEIDGPTKIPSELPIDRS